ncbi:hypothetical protein V8C42DRAFT_333722 [Trichoderma barbatum]
MHRLDKLDTLPRQPINHSGWSSWFMAFDCNGTISSKCRRFDSVPGDALFFMFFWTSAVN